MPVPSVAVPSRKFTVPLGAVATGPVKVAVKVTDEPLAMDVADDVKPIVGVALPMVTVAAVEVAAA